jgi:hypothetical protein
MAGVKWNRTLEAEHASHCEEDRLVANGGREPGMLASTMGPPDKVGARHPLPEESGY